MHCLICADVFDCAEEAFDHAEARNHPVYLPPTPLRSKTELDAIFSLQWGSEVTA